MLMTSAPFWDISPKRVVLFLDFSTLEDGTDTSSRNVGKGLQLDTALYLRKSQISITFSIRYVAAEDNPLFSGDIRQKKFVKREYI
jgi:hypothetical protein